MPWFNFFDSPVGMIAGATDFPLVIAEAAKSLNKKITIFAIEGHTDPKISSYGHEIFFFKIGAIQELLNLLKKNKIKRVILAGSAPKGVIYNPNSGLDETAKKFVQSTKNKGDDHLLRAFSLFLKLKSGADVIDSRLFLKKVMAPRGVLTKRKPTKEEKDDLKFGFKIAKQVGKLDIGQTVVVKRGIVLAVEALEGTDKAIQRGAEWGGGSVVVVKTSKPNQDVRFDLPCVGLNTLESLKNGNSVVLGIEAKKTILLHREKLIEKANQENITIVGL